MLRKQISDNSEKVYYVLSYPLLATTVVVEAEADK